MRYLNTLDIWDHTISKAIRSGQLKLQVGQWLTCGVNSEHRCRFVSSTRLTIWVTHWQGSSKATNKKWLDSVHVVRGHKNNRK